jgi:hypothetical protein
MNFAIEVSDLAEGSLTAKVYEQLTDLGRLFNFVHRFIGHLGAHLNVSLSLYPRSDQSAPVPFRFGKPPAPMARYVVIMNLEFSEETSVERPRRSTPQLLAISSF